MRIQIPKSLHLEHEELHDFLAAARKEPGELGNALRSLAQVLEPHFHREEAFALPPLGLLVRLVRNDVSPAMAEVYPHTEWLKNNLPTLMAEHQAIAKAVQELVVAARAAKRIDHVEFAEKVLNHARLEEEVIYPAAILVGEYLRLRLSSNEGVVAL